MENKFEFKYRILSIFILLAFSLVNVVAEDKVVGKIEWVHPANFRIFHDEIIITDSISYFRTQNVDQSLHKCYTQVILDDPISKEIKAMLCHIYSQNNSIIKPRLPKSTLYVYSESHIYASKLEINGVKYNEKINLYDYYVTYFLKYEINPFIAEFEKMEELIYAISFRMQHEFYDVDYVDQDELKKDKDLGLFYNSDSVTVICE